MTQLVPATSDSVVATAASDAVQPSASPRVDEAAWRVLAQVNEWIRAADTKAGAHLAASGVLGGLLVSSPPDEGGPHLVFFLLATGSVGASALFSLLALLPRTGRRLRPDSLIYFDHVARRFGNDRAAYVAALAALAGHPPAAVHEVASQTWANSLIARRKFRFVGYATGLIGVAMFCAAATALLRGA